ncbi:MAG: NADH:ubiquinone oxidoreductase subunit J [Rhodospirillaceae bacterium]|nr:NADH:ubiquinone oxidoreductase subunit J [Rhodospirillaceae bacterium]|tara:strand:- start:593 stop:1204 length:612 start_codon:yes stop_codon:yes gene_type:complete
MIAAIAFYCFSAVAVGSAIMVISARNPVHSVLFLILTFFNAAGLFILIGAEFIAMILIVVYVGAVAVLFLFVVMMLDIGFAQMREGFLQYLPVGGLIGIILAVELILVGGSWSLSSKIQQIRSSPTPSLEKMTNTHAIGNVLYTEYIYLFQGAGLTLLVAMVGAIVLTLRTRRGVKKQKIAKQIARRPEDSVKLHNVQTGSGV